MIVRVTEVVSSYHMEKEGLSRGLEFLIQKGLEVKVLVTDRHRQNKQVVEGNSSSNKALF